MRNSLSLPDGAFKALGTNHVGAMTEKMELTRDIHRYPPKYSCLAFSKPNCFKCHLINIVEE